MWGSGRGEYVLRAYNGRGWGSGPGRVKGAQSCPTLCTAVDYTVHGVLQARRLEWEAFAFSRGSSQPRDRTQVSRIAGGFCTSWATREAPRTGRGPALLGVGGLGRGSGGLSHSPPERPTPSSSERWGLCCVRGRRGFAAPMTLGAWDGAAAGWARCEPRALPRVSSGCDGRCHGLRDRGRFREPGDAGLPQAEKVWGGSSPEPAEGASQTAVGLGCSEL